MLKLQSKIFKRCIAICLLFSYLLTNNLFYSYVCYWNDKSYITPQWNPCKKYKIGIIMGGFGYMDKFTGKIGYVMYSENRTQNGIRPDMRNRLWRAISLWKEGHLEKILITGDMVANIHKDGTSEKNLFLHYMKKYARVPPEVFVFEQQSKNTYENVLFTSETERDSRRGLSFNNHRVTHQTQPEMFLQTRAQHGLFFRRCKKSSYDI